MAQETNKRKKMKFKTKCKIAECIGKILPIVFTLFLIWGICKYGWFVK